MAATAPAAAAAKKLRMPNEKEHKEKMDAWAKEIASLEAEMATLVTPKPEEGKEVVKTKTPVQIKRDGLFETLKGFKAHREAWTKEKDAHQAAVEKLNATVAKLTAEREASKAGPRPKSAAEIDESIAKLNARIANESLSLAEEKRIVAEIATLKKSKGALGDIATRNASISSARDEISKHRDAISALVAQLKEQRPKEDAIKAELDTLKDAGQSEYQKRSQRRTEVKKLLDGLYQIRREANQKYQAERQAHYEAMKEEREAAKKKRDEEYKAYKEAKALEDAARAKAREEYEATLHPWEAEMKTCDLLIAYLKPLAPAEEPAAAAAPAATTTTTPAVEGKGTVLKPKYEREGEEGGFFAVKKRPSAAAAAASGAGKTTVPKDRPLKHDPAVFEHFLSLGLAAPAKGGDVPALLAKVVALKEEYNVKPRPAKKTKAPKAAEPVAAAEGAAAEPEAAAEPAAASSE